MPEYVLGGDVATIQGETCPQCDGETPFLLADPDEPSVLMCPKCRWGKNKK